VEYFFRREDSGVFTFACPDTDVVTPQNSESSTDGHRWQQFGVLPDRWKSISYVHPVLGTAGAGDACMLYVDANDRRGNERTWMGVSDSIGATAAPKYGAHNGWHAAGDGDVNDPSSFVRKHIGQPGTTWDMYGIKASESSNSKAGGLGSRESFKNPANTQINEKRSRLGPTQEMLNAYYKIILFLSGDGAGTIHLGPRSTNYSTNDLLVLQNFLLSGNTATPNRGFFAEGDGFVEDADGFAAGATFLANFTGVALRDYNYIAISGNSANSTDVLPTDQVDCHGGLDVYGVRNACTFTLDVMDQDPGLAAETDVASFYGPVGPNAPYISGIVKHHAAAHPWISLVDGWDIENLHAKDEISGRGRLTYFYNVFSCIFSAICQIQGNPGVVTDTPTNNDGRLFNFMSLRNNPVRTGSATVDFGLPKTGKVKMQVYDVSGRLVRTLADRVFPAGKHTLTWDGTDNAGKQVARGVYFVRSVHEGNSFEGKSKVVVLR
jgi:hypothetical protein